MAPEYQMPTSLMMDECDSVDNGIVVLCRRARRVLWLVVRDGRRVVLKGLTEELRTHPEEIGALRKEYLLALRIESQGVAHVYGFEHHPKLGPVIVMEYLYGVPLHQYLSDGAEMTEGRGRSPKLSQRLRIAIEIAETLVSVHSAGVSHRDLKPDNILISSKDLSPKIIDFGNGDAEDFVIYKQSLGTEQYGAPEQMVPSGGGKASDVYSFGKILDDLLPERQFKGIRKACKVEDASMRPDIERVSRRLKRHRAYKYKSAGALFCVIVLMLITGVSWYVESRVIDYPLDAVSVERDLTPEPSHEQPGLQSRVKEPDVTLQNKETPHVATASSRVEIEDKEVGKTVEEVSSGGGMDEIIDKYIKAADNINGRYGKIPYDGVNETENNARRLERADEHYKLADRMEKELDRLGKSKTQITGAKHKLWNHIVMETNRIDGVTGTARKIMEIYGFSSTSE